MTSKHQKFKKLNHRIQIINPLAKKLDKSDSFGTTVYETT